MKNTNKKLEKEIEKSQEQELTTISISKKNYFILKRMGQTSDSFNDVLTRLLEQHESESTIGSYNHSNRF